MEYNLGMLLGLLGGLFVGLLVVHFLKRRKIIDFTFDERQLLARGKAYTWAFYTLVVCVLLYAVSDTIFVSWCDTFLGVFLCIALAVAVFAGVCIRMDAYLSLKERPKTVMLTFAVIALLNLAVSFTPIHEGKLFENGMLTFHAINLVCGILFVIIMAMYAAKCVLSRGDE